MKKVKTFGLWMGMAMILAGTSFAQDNKPYTETGKKVSFKTNATWYNESDSVCDFSSVVEKVNDADVCNAKISCTTIKDTINGNAEYNLNASLSCSVTNCNNTVACFSEYIQNHEVAQYKLQYSEAKQKYGEPKNTALDGIISNKDVIKEVKEAK